MGLLLGRATGQHCAIVVVCIEEHNRLALLLKPAQCRSPHSPLLWFLCASLLCGLQDQKIDSAGGDANFEALAKYGTDLTANAARLDPVIGRDEEIRRVVRILSR